MFSPSRPPIVLLCAMLLVPVLARAQAPDRPLQDGDRLLVKIWSDSVFADSVRVQSHGTIVLPRFGTLSLAAVPASAIPDSVRRAYSGLLRTATVEVTPLRRVTVVGEVAHPSVYFLETNSRVRDAVALAGGVTDVGVQGHLTLVRGQSQTKLKNWLQRNDDEAAIQSGDIVIVDRESWFKRNAFTVVSGVSVLLSLIITLSK